MLGSALASQARVIWAECTAEGRSGNSMNGAREMSRKILNVSLTSLKDKSFPQSIGFLIPYRTLIVAAGNRVDRALLKLPLLLQQKGYRASSLEELWIFLDIFRRGGDAPGMPMEDFSSINGGKPSGGESETTYSSVKISEEEFLI